jgi:hypothetical protein
MLYVFLDSNTVDASVPNVVEKLMDSSEYFDLQTQLMEEAKNAASVLLTESNLNKNTRNNHNNNNTIYTFHDASNHSNMTNESSSGSLSSCVSLSVEEVRSLVVNLHSKIPSEMRNGAIQKLEGFSTADILSSEFWPEVKTGLENALADNDPK